MGYACPVCSTPQADGEHLANHLAFTAMLQGDEHEAWLDEYVPDWGEDDPESLAPRVTPHVEEEEFPQVFDDTTHDGHDHSLEEHLGGQARHRGRGALASDGDDAEDVDDGDVDDVLEEARRMTEAMLEDEDSETE